MEEFHYTEETQLRNISVWRKIMEDKIKVLFICRHNSGRSQIAEAYLKRFAGDRFIVEGAGFEPADSVNELVIEVMKEEGIDLSGKRPQSVFEQFKSGRLYDYVITVCDDSESKCPIFPGIAKRLHRSFPDPSKVEGTPDEKLRKVREIRDHIRAWIADRDGGVGPFEDFLNA
jgi:arsenate reductase (thioredoxin)